MKKIFELAIALLAAASPNVLVQYSFDDQLIDTGPDTFAIYQHAKGHVRLVSHIRYSGYRAIELRDVAGDGDFPEVQGYFPARTAGQLFFHFAMLTATPDESFNIALAGPSWFQLSKDGIAFWLKADGGTLHHMSDSIPKKLFKLEAFVWYVVDVRLDVARGTYDLTIRRERNPQPVVELKDQPNAANAPGSAVDKFSFVGSVFEDDSNVAYYVDDVVLSTDEKVPLGPFVAPGRRKLFVDRWKEARKLSSAARGAKCPPILSLADFGLEQSVTDFESQPAVKEFREACKEMSAVRFAADQKQFPNAPIFALAELTALDDHDAALARWNDLAPLLEHDVRYGMVLEDANPYYTMLWKGEYARAARFAEKMNWPERVGDALFLSGSPQLARRWYEEALQREPNAYWPATKLSDVFFILGDTANEQLYRQRMYGRLAE